MEQNIIIASTAIGATFVGIFTFIKSCDWLIGLKYLSKDKFKEEIDIFSKEQTKKFASVESHNHLKEDMLEIKEKLNDIHDVIMTFAVHNLKDR